MINLPTSKLTSEFISFTGGLDVVSPQIMASPGSLRRSYNFEEDVNGGYSRVAGYERFNGMQSPSSATYKLLYASDMTAFSEGDTITGSTSKATGTVIGIIGSFYAVTNIVGTFQTEVTNKPTCSITIPAPNNTAIALDQYQRAQFSNKSADVYRSMITEVPGVGSILGVFYYKGYVYAFRNNDSGGTRMYKSSSNGWQQVNMGYAVSFTAASGTPPSEGDTITKGTASGVLKRLIIESGTFAASNAVGRLVFSSITGTFTSGSFTSGITATCGSQGAINLPQQNGRFEVARGNFTGLLTTQRVYIVDGANIGFEFDGETVAQFVTGVSPEAPSHVIVHHNHLFVAYGSSVFHSALGNPYDWQGLNNAGNIAIGDTVTGFSTMPGTNSTDALIIYGKNSTYILYGTSYSTWQLMSLNDGSGAYPYTMQRIWQSIALDDRGVTTIGTVQEFGNFSESTISKNVLPWIIDNRKFVCDSHISRDKQQYRVFFSNGYGMYWLIEKKKLSMMPVKFSNPVLCSDSYETYGGGEELIFFGSDNGFVYQMERGTSFDGEPILAEFELTFNHSKSIRVLKKYRRATFNLSGNDYANFNFSYRLDYGKSTASQPVTESHEAELMAAMWDHTATTAWDYFYWDGIPLQSLPISINGQGENISLRISLNNDYSGPIRFNGVLLEYSSLRMLR